MAKRVASTQAQGPAPGPDAEEFARRAAAALAKERTGSVIQVDLDEFHQVNVQAGHDAGDRVVGAAIRVLARTAKDEGWLYGRVGGDEFALLAPGLALEPAFLRAERLRVELNEALAAAVPKGMTCTVSVGVANLPRDAKNPDDLLRQGGHALYAAKEQGGNAVGLTPGEEMVMRSSYYRSGQLARLRALAERLKTKEAVLLREALDDLLLKYERS
ncbi:MAG: diguanylate cyclase [Candidatus Limnocylindria bacterium]